MTTIPTAQEILCLYLYGQKTPPSDLKSDVLIRAEGLGEEPAIVDINEYMTTGGGRFVKVESFRYVRNFLAGNDSAYIKEKVLPGIYSAKKLLDIYEVSEKDRELGIQQYSLGLWDTDYIDRSYVFGSGNFKINDDAKFIVNSDGSREIIDIAVVPAEDNFDFTSDSRPAQITNWMTKERLDPSNIGRKVPIIFTGEITGKQDLTGEDWYALEISHSLSQIGKQPDDWLIKWPVGGVDFTALMIQFAIAGIIDYKDSAGRFIYYDGISPTNDGTLNAEDGLGKVNSRGTLYDGAVALIGGGGNDQLNATDKNDELYGGTGDDTLDGGSGKLLTD